MNTQVNTKSNEYKNSRKERKETHPFSTAFFTVGTTCVVNVCGGDLTIEVKRLIKNGPHSYILETPVFKDVTGCNEAFNICYVRKIIKRAPGVAVVHEAGHGYGVPNKKYLKEFFDENVKNNMRCYDPTEVKHHSRYKVMDVNRLVGGIAFEIANSMDHVIDVEKMVSLLRQQHIFHLDNVDWGYMSSVNKKKLRKAIKRVFNKCLMNQYKAQDENDREWEHLHDDPDDREDDRAIRFETVNEHGHKQMMMEDPGDCSKNIPVCNTCYERYVNKGTGMMCDMCAREDDRMMEAHFGDDFFS